MNTRHPIIFRGIAALTTFALSAGCGTDSPSEIADVTTVPSSTSTSNPPENSEPELASTTTTLVPSTTIETGQVIDIEVVDATVVGGANRIEVSLGEKVTLRVSADVADELHIHGYDLTDDVSATEAGEIIFTADIPGVFEVELENAGLELVRLEVS
jgi:hypothetical protein